LAFLFTEDIFSGTNSTSGKEIDSNATEKEWMPAPGAWLHENESAAGFVFMKENACSLR